MNESTVDYIGKVLDEIEIKIRNQVKRIDDNFKILEAKTEDIYKRIEELEKKNN